MKTLRTLAMICLMFGSASIALSQADAKAPFSIVIENDKPTVVAGSKVYIRIKQTNTSDHEVDCSEFDVDGVADMSYMYDVRDENDRPMAIDYFKLHPVFGGSWRPCTLPPGESTVSTNYLISSVNDFSRPDTYTVQVSRYIGPDDKHDSVYSNKITLRIVPPEEAALSAQDAAPATVENTPQGETEPLIFLPGSKSESGEGLPRSIDSLQSADFSLDISQDLFWSSACKCITIDVKVANLTDTTLDDSIQGPLAAKYQYSIKRDGVEVPEDEELRSIRQVRLRKWNPREIRFGSGQGYRIPPHSSIKQILMLGPYFDMKTPGTYEITVSRSSNRLEPEKGALVRSNTLMIVVPKAVEVPAAQ